MKLLIHFPSKLDMNLWLSFEDSNVLPGLVPPQYEQKVELALPLCPFPNFGVGPVPATAPVLATPKDLCISLVVDDHGLSEQRFCW